MSDRSVYVCIYGRYKPGKVHKQFQGDGKAFISGRQLVLVCDDSKDEMGRAEIPPHKDIASGKEFLVKGTTGTFEVQLGDLFDGHAVRPPSPEPAAKKMKPFKLPGVASGDGPRANRSHPYDAGSRFVRRGDYQPAPDVKHETDDGDDHQPLNVRNQLVTAAEGAAVQRPQPKKTKYSLF